MLVMGGDWTTTVEIRADLLEALRALHPGRSDREIVEAAVREYLLSRDGQPRESHQDDVMLQALAAAPLDDEGTTGEEDRLAHEAIEDYLRGATVSSDQLKRELRRAAG